MDGCYLARCDQASPRATALTRYQMIAVARKAVADVNVVVTSMYFNRHNYDRFISIADMACSLRFFVSLPFISTLLFLETYQMSYRRKDSRFISLRDVVVTSMRFNPHNYDRFISMTCSLRFFSPISLHPHVVIFRNSSNTTSQNRFSFYLFER